VQASGSQYYLCLPLEDITGLTALCGIEQQEQGDTREEYCQIGCKLMQSRNSRWHQFIDAHQDARDDCADKKQPGDQT